VSSQKGVFLSNERPFFPRPRSPWSHDVALTDQDAPLRYQGA
jgi:hypothetical protein